MVELNIIIVLVCILIFLTVKYNLDNREQFYGKINIQNHISQLDGEDGDQGDAGIIGTTGSVGEDGKNIYNIIEEAKDTLSNNLSNSLFQNTDNTDNTDNTGISLYNNLKTYIQNEILNSDPLVTNSNSDHTHQVPTISPTHTHQVTVTDETKRLIESLENDLELSFNSSLPLFSVMPIHTKIDPNELNGKTIIPHTELNGIPEGWQVCNGADNSSDSTYDIMNKVPDLRGRFILGGANTTLPGNIDGNRLANATLNFSGTQFDRPDGRSSIIGSTMHTLSYDEMASHRHTQARGGYYNGMVWTRNLGEAFECKPHRGGSLPNTGGGQAHNNMPPFTILVYIIRVN